MRPCNKQGNPFRKVDVSGYDDQQGQTGHGQTCRGDIDLNREAGTPGLGPRYTENLKKQQPLLLPLQLL